MHITPFGLVFLPVGAWIFFRHRTWVPGLLIVAACLHAPAVAIVGTGPDAPGHGVTPWAITCFAIFLHLCALAGGHLSRSLRESSLIARTLLAGWGAFAVLGILSAFSLPFLFEGVPTYNTMETLSIAAGTTPLEWRTSNAVLALNLGLVAMLFIYGVLARPLAAKGNQVINGLVVASLLAATLSLVQRALITTEWLDLSFVQDSLNPSYHHTVGNIFWRDGLRMGWPFSEPSYASAWFATCFAAGLALYLWTDTHRRAAITILVAGTIGLIGSFSATGIVTAAACFITIWTAGCWYAWERRGRDKGQRLKRHGAVALVAFLVASASYLAAVNNERNFPRYNVYSTWDAAKLYVRNKVEDHERSGNTRTESNRVAIELLVKTSGLGVGLGSNRASSYALNLLSNVGVLPSVLLGALLLVQWRLLWGRNEQRTCAIVLTVGGGTMLLAVGIGVPDLLWPAWWIWPILTYWQICSVGKPAPVERR